MWTVLSYVIVASISGIAGFFLAAIMFISGRESDREMFDDIPGDLKDRGL